MDHTVILENPRVRVGILKDGARIPYDLKATGVGPG